MKRHLINIVYWLLKKLKGATMKTLTQQVHYNHSELRKKVVSTIDELQQATIIESFEYKDFVQNFKKLDEDCFFYSVHGKDYFVRTEYELTGEPYAVISTSKSEYDYNSYPNRKLTPINSLDIKVSLTEEMSINNKTIKDFPSDYLEAVTDFMYSGQVS